MKKYLLVGVLLEKDHDALEKVEEVKALALANDGYVGDVILQRRRSYHPATLFGEGKLLEIAEAVKGSDIDEILFMQDITPSQMRQIKEVLKLPLLTRTDLILQIFANRASTAQAKVQVEVAVLKHQLPYVIHTVQNFSRQGGSGKNKGEGEKQLELDRRKIEQQIQRLNKTLKEIKKHSDVHQRHRSRQQMKVVSLVGYTNAGKSTLMNALLDVCEGAKDKQVFVKDMLFATLDTTLRRLQWKDEVFLLSDTVGFVSDLPHELIEAFHSTLEVVKEADLILQVVDESSEKKTMQMQVTHNTLSSLGVDEEKMIYVHNKCDRAAFGKNDHQHVYISAEQKVGLDVLLDMILQRCTQLKCKWQVIVPFENGELLKRLKEEYSCLKIFSEEGGWRILMEGYPSQKRRLEEEQLSIIEI